MENSPSPIKSSEPVTPSPARDRSADLRRITEAMLMPIGYELGIGHLCPCDMWDLCVVHADHDGETDFDQPIVTGSREDVDTAISTLISALDARRAVSEHHSGPVSEDHDDSADAKAFRSRFEHVDRPSLLLEHTPGWTWQDTGDTISPTYYLFRSTDPVFDMQFSVIERQDGSLETSLISETWDKLVSAEDLLKYGDGTKRFAQWLDDSATITAWVRGNDTVKEARNA
jgi:hypothetical protein